jgi:hypothetical protein
VVSGNSDICAVPESLVIKSMAPGCVAKMLAAVSKGGLATATPGGCEYE